MSDASILWPPIVELRQYTLHPGRRDTLIDLFERELIEPQLALGMQLPGLFRDLDHPDRFVWLRGFADMPARGKALAAFYGGIVWQQHRDAANATMIDSDDVLLLRPVPRMPASPPASRGNGLVTATLCALPAPADTELLERFERVIAPLWTEAGARLLGVLVTESATNNYPRLPVREGEPVIAWLARFTDPAAQRDHAVLLGRSLHWAAWCEALVSAPRHLRLAPTARSALQP
jgi:hypothetical protein